MCKVESIVNGRPITKVSDDPRNWTHSPPIICCYFEEDRQCHPERFQERTTTAVVDGAKYSISATCLSDDGRENITFVTATPKVEQATEKSRCEWYCAASGRKHAPRSSRPLGRVIEVYSNRRDGLVRSAKVKTRSTKLVRPVDKIVLLESSSEDAIDASKDQ